MRKVIVLRMRERYAQTVLTFRITYVYFLIWIVLWEILLDGVSEYAQHFGAIVKCSMIYQKSLIPILITLIVENVSDLICTLGSLKVCSWLMLQDHITHG